MTSFYFYLPIKQNKLQSQRETCESKLSLFSWVSTQHHEGRGDMITIHSTL